ncbi:MAG: type II toxin-antitoxin system PemK/MazF family toxin [Verrucomicrobiota bacterium]
MRHDCAVNCDHIQTVSKGKIGALVTHLPPARMDAVGKAVGFALNLK